jgi:hypothetical protein
MPRPRQRICLESGLRLDLNKLRRQGLVCPGVKRGAVIRWTNTYTGEDIANGVITSNMEGTYEGWLRIQLGSLDQTITLVPKPRHFGGHQWYFVCPLMNRYVSVLWMPPGAHRFCSRQAWGTGGESVGCKFITRQRLWEATAAHLWRGWAFLRRSLTRAVQNGGGVRADPRSCYLTVTY